jgi:hypothetical protein
LKRPKYSTVAGGTGVVVGSSLAVWDFIAGPSLNLWAINATVVLALALESAALLLVNGPQHTWSSPSEPRPIRRRMPLDKMLVLMNGAREGYTQNRKELAQMLRSAVDAKLAAKTGPLPGEVVEARISEAVGQRLYSELFSEEGWRPAKVERSPDYLAHLNEGVGLLRKSLGL